METHKPLLKDADGEDIDEHMEGCLEWNGNAAKDEVRVSADSGFSDCKSITICITINLLSITSLRDNLVPVKEEKYIHWKYVEGNAVSTNMRLSMRRWMTVWKRAATTATSFDAEQDRGNITNIQSKETPNEPSSLGTSYGGGPAPKKPHGRVLSLETIKTTQAMEITSLKRRVKKLEKRNKSRTHGLKRLYKVGLSRRVESSDEEGLGEEDASKQVRIDDIDANKDIYLVNVHRDKDMFGVNDLEGDEVRGCGDPFRKWGKRVEGDEMRRFRRRGEERLAREKDEANVILIEEWDDIQAKIDADYQLA
ncbi:hypothetical protein Tco_0934354 [Tanacetum coccineum]